MQRGPGGGSVQARLLRRGFPRAHYAAVALSPAPPHPPSYRYHFGDEQIWTLPVSMRWDALNESLLRPSLGGFDPYAYESAAGGTHDTPTAAVSTARQQPPQLHDRRHLAGVRAGSHLERPRLASKLTVYLRGEGVAEKRGYFIVSKLEEMAWRTWRRRAFPNKATRRQLTAQTLTCPTRGEG